jgi:hypothetical protein
VNAVPSVTLDISRSCKPRGLQSCAGIFPDAILLLLSDLTDRSDSNAMPIVKLIFQSMNGGFQIEMLDSNTQGLFLLPADEFKLRLFSTAQGPWAQSNFANPAHNQRARNRTRDA